MELKSKHSLIQKKQEIEKESDKRKELISLPAGCDLCSLL